MIGFYLGQAQHPADSSAYLVSRRVLAVLLIAAAAVSGCSSTPRLSDRSADLQARQVFTELQAGVTVEVAGTDYSRVIATGLTDLNRARAVDGMATGCVEAGGEFRGMTRSDGWVCYLPGEDRPAFAVLYTPDSLQLLRIVGSDEGFTRELRRYGYVQQASR